MNRPELKKFSAKGMNWEEIFEKEFHRYRDFANELEKYCDELERALDKASEHLNELECVLLGSNEHTWTKEQWKEWALEDE